MVAATATTACSASAALAVKLAQEAQQTSATEATPSTAPNDSEDESPRSQASSSASTRSMPDEEFQQRHIPGAPASSSTGAAAPRQSQDAPSPPADSEAEEPRELQAGTYHTTEEECSRSRPVAPAPAPQAPPCPPSKSGKFEKEETLFIFDWDDTVLPSTWVQRQGLRLDNASVVTSEQLAILAEVADAAGKTMRAARQHGTVVLVTNAERGWIELSCRKFLPTLSPMLENVRMVSARTTYEGPQCKSPLDWKLRAFDAEIARFYGAEVVNDPSMRKNVFSLGDSVHEREALMRATSAAPGCLSKSLKFVERPDVSQIRKQHELIFGCFEQIVHHESHMDLCIRCP